MKKQDLFYLGCFLNRMAANYSGNPLKADPLKVLKDFFELAGGAASHIKAFDDFCLAALKDGYHWKNGSPGNGLFYGEQLELLVEAAFLIYRKRGKYRVRKQPVATVPVSVFPVLLTASEYRDPLGFIESFFGHAALSYWKKALSHFTAAAISGSSVVDDMEAADIFKFISWLKKLVYAAARLTETAERSVGTEAG